MPKVSETPQQRFDRRIVQLGAGDPAPSARRKGFGTSSLFVGRKMFGLLDASGGLVLKLPPERVQELIAQGKGTGWHPGSGKPLKEYVAIAFPRHGEWLTLTKEARAYMAGKT